MIPTPRRLADDDDLDALTDLLHRAYAPLAAQGLRYWATHQSVDDTRRRCADGETWVIAEDGRILATVTLAPPDRSGNCPLYARPDVAHVHQLAVDPDHQGRGLAHRLMDHLEDRARALGAAMIALDTSEHATALIGTYTRRGYHQVGEADWRPQVNYRSVLLGKALR